MDLIDYVASLPPIKITRLYENPFTCLAVFRSLAPLAKHYVLSLLFVEDVPQSLVASWALPSAYSKHSAAIDVLTRLQVLFLPSKSVEPAYCLSKSFCEHLRHSACSGTASQLNVVPEGVTTAAPAKGFVDDYAATQWETLLLYAVGGGPCPDPAPHLQSSISLNLEELLLAAGLVSLTDGSGASASRPSSSSQQQPRHSVTQLGFQFLLADTYSQLWQLLREYIARAERQSSTELASALGFLLQLGFQGERPLCCSDLEPQQRDIAAHMAQLGVLYTFQVGGEVWLKPTRLAVLMASGVGSSPAAASDGFVVVESNARVYAYTSSPIRQAILRLFVRCDVLLPNLFVGTITRESATAALESGVGAEQIIGYLRQHAHARVANRIPIVPGVVADQIRLWQRDLQRLSHRAAVHYKNFEGEELYRKVVAYVVELGALLARDDMKKELVAAAEAHPKIRDRIKALKETLGY
ncbi:putative General transcription and DNA repair factor IIH subunit TFB2 [Nannochloris sp. 'desiccata']|nr:hypothetical protein KSW81_008193 [Chlorella desiccata (nom. nud.)]KAH7619456.1 putative General transcription and DNA repair factor IIH subunit TFB2 [Chlorella desiccata (nom. nud.)]